MREKDAKDRIIEQRMARRRHNALVIRSLIALMLLLIGICVILLIRAGIKDGAFDDTIRQIRKKMGGNSTKQTITENTPEKETHSPVTEEAMKKLETANMLAT